MTAAWWDDLKTAGSAGTHAAGDDGEDLNTPDNTPVSFMEPGQVIDASYHVYGGQVVVHMPDGYDEYWIHLNNIYVHPGDSITPGETIGTSGGGVGDYVLHNGTVEPAQDQSWYEGHSSGYHSETGFFEDTSAHGDMGQFNQGWGNAGRQLDPRPMIQQYAAGNPPSLPVQGQTLSDTTKASLTDPSTWGPALANGVAQAAGFTDAGNMLVRIAAGGAGLGLCVLAAYLAVKPEADTVISTAGKTAAKGAALL